MLTEEKLKTLPHPAQGYWRRAQDFVIKNQNDWVEIRPKTTEFDSWREYFEHYLKFEPYGLKQIRRGLLSVFLVPAQWPEWFDPDYAGQNTHPKAV